MAIPVILASASPRRCALLRELDVPFQVVQSDATEIHNEQLTASELCQINAYRKARAVALAYPDSLVIGADTLVYLGTELFGKPVDTRHARQMLQKLQGKTHQVYTGVCLLHLRGRRQKLFAERTHVTFKPLTREEVQSYTEKVNTLDKAGAYAIQDNGDKIVADISGSYSNVVGLPLERLRNELRFVLQQNLPVRSRPQFALA